MESRGNLDLYIDGKNIGVEQVIIYSILASKSEVFSYIGNYLKRQLHQINEELMLCIWFS
jgi:hypothetical protein